MSRGINLEEFVSDYWTIIKEDPTIKWTTNDIAEAYMETNEMDGEVTSALIADINYLLPAPR